MLSTLEIHERRGSDAITLALQGELDLCSGAQLAVRLADEGRLGARVIVDLTELDFIDSAGMGVLQRASLWAGEEGWNLAVTGPQPEVARVLRLTGLVH
jgi:anti-sigma B factor antagonist